MDGGAHDGIPLADKEEMSKKEFGTGGDLTHDEIVIACRNFGIDITCGNCAMLFYTGFGGYPHDEHCKTAVEESQ